MTHTATLSPHTPDLLGALLQIEEGLYAISAIVRGPFERNVATDEARAGVAYLAGKIRADLRAVINPLSDADALS